MAIAQGQTSTAAMIALLFAKFEWTAKILIEKWNGASRKTTLSYIYLMLYDYIHSSTYVELPIWNFDGSSTGQAEGKNSDVFLYPRAIYNDPFRPEGNNNKLILCETFKHNKKPTETNHRFSCNTVMERAKVQKELYSQKHCVWKLLYLYFSGPSTLVWYWTGVHTPWPRYASLWVAQKWISWTSGAYF